MIGGAADLVYNIDDHTIGGEIDIETGIITFWSGDKEGSRKINYCPMCGKAIKRGTES